MSDIAIEIELHGSWVIPESSAVPLYKVRPGSNVQMAEYLRHFFLASWVEPFEVELQQISAMMTLSMMIVMTSLIVLKESRLHGFIYKYAHAQYTPKSTNIYQHFSVYHCLS